MPKGQLQTRFRFDTSRNIPFKECMITTDAAISNGEPVVGIRFAFDNWNDPKPSSIRAKMNIEAAQAIVDNLTRQIAWCKEHAPRFTKQAGE